MKKALTYGAGLIALYLVATNALGVKTVATAGSGGLSTIIRSLQGRN